MEVTLSRGNSQAAGGLGQVNKVTVPWDKFIDRMTTHEEAKEKGGAFFVGGHFSSKQRKEHDMVSRTLLTLDADKLDMSIDEIEFELISLFNSFVAYTTFSHGKNDQSSLRIVMPLSREVSPDEYRHLSRAYGQTFPLRLDECSYKPNQAMFFPTCPDTDKAWSMSQDGPAVDVDHWLGEAEDIDDEPFGDADLSRAISEQPLELSDGEIDQYLEYYPSESLEYDDWLSVGAALHHQHKGSEAGYDKWLTWSMKSTKHDDRQMETKYRSFGSGSRLTTFATIIFKAKENGGIDAPVVNEDGETSTQFEVLMEEASDILTLSGYREFKEKVSGIPASILPPDLRSMLAQQVATGFGKREGVTKGDIKKAISPRTAVVAEDEGERPMPTWLEDWVYIESTSEYHNTDLSYSIKREAFNAKYDRERECLMNEVSSSHFALVMRPIPTVVDKMYWPGADRIFKHEGKRMLNSYVPDGVEPCKELDEDGQKVVDMFLGHIEFTLAEPDEQQILLDWMCYVVQNPGKRINWALLLQGAQGTGKTYFINVLQMVLGRNVSNLDPTSIAGRFTGWAHGSLVIGIEEIRIAGSNKFEILDRMKPFITNRTVMIEEKGRDHRTVPNFTNYFNLSNHQDAVPLLGGDRRWAILFGRIQSEAQLYNELGGEKEAGEYFDRLFDDSYRRSDALAYFLKTREISADFNPTGRAPKTKAREKMVQLSISPERCMVEDALTKHECDIINKDVLDVSYLKQLCQLEDDELPKTRALSAILLEMGYQQVDKRVLKIASDRKNHYVWFGSQSESTLAKVKVKEFHDDPDYCPF